MNDKTHTLRCTLALAVALALCSPTGARAQSSADSAPAVDPTQFVSADPFGLMFEWFNVEYERKVSPSTTLGGSVSWFSLDAGEFDYVNGNALVRYYPGRALNGFFLGGRAAPPSDSDVLPPRARRFPHRSGPRPLQPRAAGDLRYHRGRAHGTRMSDRDSPVDLDALCDLFARHHGARPLRVVRAPGRVNLIGDHTDYNGLPVLPMAIQHGIVVLARPREDGEVRLANADPGFEPASFDLAPAIPPHPAGHWANYAKAAGQALVTACGPLCGFDGLVHGTIPQAAGLSSSSALVVAAALALADANALEIEARSLMALLADGEHYVGTRGGGMDQAICLGAERGAATRIGFRPLRLTPVTIPADWRYVVAFSGVRAQKSAAAREVYNQRTRECAEAFGIVADEVGLAPDQRSWPALIAWAGAEALVALAPSALDDPLDRRFRHVVTEAARVEAATAAMRAGDLVAFGRLMTDSHRSLRGDYEVSCEALDTLVALALARGAAGARLTGAGFGGSVVALTAAAASDGLVECWTDEFCRPRGLTDAVFVAEASDGAEVKEVRSER